MRTHQVLCSPLGVLCDDSLRQAVHLVLDRVLHIDVLSRCVFLQRPGFRIERSVFYHGLRDIAARSAKVSKVSKLTS